MTRPTASTDLPYDIQWSEGLLLSPQHLQQSDRFWHARLRYLIGCASPDFVGVHALELDEGLLEKGRVVVRSIECVLDDGTPVQLRRERDKPLELDVSGKLAQAGDRATIALVLPMRGEASAARGSMNRRYESMAGAAAVDENTGMTAVTIARLRPIVRLDAEWTRGANQLAGCPLFELERTPLGAFRRTAYHPPMATLGASAFLRDKALGQRVEALRDAVRLKLREIAQAGETAGADPASGDLSLGMAARRLAMMLPGLDVLGVGGDAAPRDVYLFLAEAAGQVASLDPLPDPPVLPPYDHFDCHAGFDAALGFIEARVAAIRPSFERLPFERDDDGQFSRLLPADSGDVLLVEVVPAAAQTRADIDRWFESCAIAHPTLLDELDSRRMPGAAAALSPVRRKGMNPAALYYEIRNAAFDFADGKRKAFTAGERLAIRNGSRHARAHAPAAVVLYREPGATQTSHAAPRGHERHPDAARDGAHESARPAPEHDGPAGGQGGGHDDL